MGTACKSHASRHGVFLQSPTATAGRRCHADEKARNLFRWLMPVDDLHVSQAWVGGPAHIELITEHTDYSQKGSHMVYQYLEPWDVRLSHCVSPKGRGQRVWRSRDLVAWVTRACSAESTASAGDPASNIKGLESGKGKKKRTDQPPSLKKRCNGSTDWSIRLCSSFTGTRRGTPARPSPCLSRGALVHAGVR